MFTAFVLKAITPWNIDVVDNTRYTMLLALLFLGQFGFILPQSFDREIGTINVSIGDTATLLCDLRNVYDNQYIIWYHENRRRYISYNEEIFPDIPEEVSRRFSVVCGDRVEDYCSLTITDLTIEDMGEYACGYCYKVSCSTTFLVTGILQISSGTPPSEASPICEIYTSKNGQYIPDQAYSIGDDIFLQCSVTGGASPKPSIYWMRNGTAISVAAKGLTIAHQVLLTREDIGVVFTCMMSHPLISAPRSCTLIPLPIEIFHTTSSTMKTEKSPLTPTKLTYYSTHKHATNNSQPMASSSVKQSFILPAVIIGISVILAAVIIAVVLFLIWRKRFQKSAIPRRLDYNVTFDRGECSITPDYAVVNAPDSIDNQLNNQRSNLERAQAAQQQHLLKKQQNLHPQKALNFPVYAKPDKSRNENRNRLRLNENVALYDNLPNYESGDEDEACASARVTSPNGGLTYAELDLPASRSDSPREQRTNRDATIYAKIEGTL